MRFVDGAVQGLGLLMLLCLVGASALLLWPSGAASGSPGRVELCQSLGMGLAGLTMLERDHEGAVADDARPDYRRLRVSVCDTWTARRMDTVPDVSCQLARSWLRRVDAGLIAARAVNHTAAARRLELAEGRALNALHGFGCAEGQP